ncbi:MAG: RluA family pseudouridine synthase [Alphaproteobacteria bacterium]|nr:RluA family pseudouridine synthase [Alphaproteobacteria bacterium]
MSAVTELKIKVDDADQRLDRWLKRRFPVLNQGRIEKLLRTGQIRVDGKRVKSSHRLEPDQTVRLPPRIDEVPAEVAEAAPAIRERRPVTEADAKAIRSWVIYKDDDVIVLDKPPGLAVQGGTGTERHIDGMLEALEFDHLEGRPKLVHRLDRDTSGVLVLARGAKNAQRLADSFRHRNARKLYWALVVGQPKMARGKIDLALAKEAGPSGFERVASSGEDDAKRAITLYDTVDVAAGRCTWLVMWPRTGRTHQLRVHCADGLHTPIVGDGKYGGGESRIQGEGISGKLHLHARSIELPHPSGKGMLKIKAPLPPHMRKTWEFFGFDPNLNPDPFPEA